MELLGLIVIIAFIFGIDYATALNGFVQFILIGAGIIIVLIVIGWLLTTKNGTKFVIVASAIAVFAGVSMINRKPSDIIGLCSGFYDAEIRTDCALRLIDMDDKNYNKGWAYSIIGSIVGVVSISVWQLMYKQTSQQKQPSKDVGNLE